MPCNSCFGLRAAPEEQPASTTGKLVKGGIWVALAVAVGYYLTQPPTTQESFNKRLR